MNEDEWIEHEENEDDDYYWESPSEYEDMDLDFAS